MTRKKEITLKSFKDWVNDRVESQSIGVTKLLAQMAESKGLKKNALFFFKKTTNAKVIEQENGDIDIYGFKYRIKAKYTK